MSIRNARIPPTHQTAAALQVWRLGGEVGVDQAVRAGLFDWLVEIIRHHGPGGEQAEDNVRLVLD